MLHRISPLGGHESQELAGSGARTFTPRWRERWQGPNALLEQALANCLVDQRTFGCQPLRSAQARASSSSFVQTTVAKIIAMLFSVALCTASESVAVASARNTTR